MLKETAKVKNPELSAAAAPTEIYVTCNTCGDFGYTLPPAVDAQHPKDIPAGIMFREAIPCKDCEYGGKFKEMQITWHQMDEKHLFPHEGFEFFLEHGTPSGMACQRTACTCGWKDAWYRSPK